MIGRQSDTMTGVENHALRARVAALEDVVREYLAAHGEECACRVCGAARLALCQSVVDVLLRSIRR